MRRTLALALAVTMIAGVAPAAAAVPLADGPERLVPQVDLSVPGTDVPGASAPADAASSRSFHAPAPQWPAAGSVEASALGRSPAPVRAGGLPLWVEPADERTPSAVHVEVLPRERTVATGVDGVLLRVGANARLGIDYNAFRYAYGADWAIRLRMVSLPECALSTPDAEQCRPVPLESDNSTAVGTIEATVPAGLVGLAAEESGPAGDYSATPLQPSSTWSAGGSSGDFGWSYPIRTPPAPGELAPELSLDYSSGSVDGRMAASNNQPSWMGEGFEFATGSIERKYKSCGKDGGNGASAGTGSGDLCWVTDNAVLSLNGSSTELLKGADGKWHGRAEDGSRIERRTGASNGDNDGEHWVVTTTDGTQYWFGRNRLPGWAAGKAESQSVWTVPVYGNGASDPCHSTGWCDQAWRWNLDHVVDPFGNSIAYWYAKETNRYARNLSTSASEDYVRSGYLQRIDYGTRADNAYGAVPTQVLFDARDRCATSNCGEHDATNWPDTPWDQQCTGNPCYVGSPTFWSTKRLAKVTTRVGSRDVESWTFTHTFPNPGDGTRAGLWLDRIGHTGHIGTAVSLPDITFVGTQLANRVDATDHSPAMRWWRISHINTESGGSISVSYYPEDCVRGSRMPSAPHTNTLRCYPVRWKPLGATAPIIDYFHKYVVKSVVEDDLALAPAGRSPHVVTSYEYPRPPAWHYTDDDGLILDEDKTWSAWRGYDLVRTVEGEGAERTRTDTLYFRGMHGDKLPSGTRPVTLPAAGGAPAVADEDDYAGLVREEIVYNGPSGAEVSATVSEPWRSAPTASRTIDGFTMHARHVDVAAERSRITLDGGRGQRRTQTRTTFDGFGMPVKVDDLGDETVPGDEQCAVTTYARNTGSWLMEYPSREQTFAVDCARAAGTGLTEADVIDDTYTSYDQQARGAAPTKGSVSRVEELQIWPSTYIATSRATHDALGRATQSWDVRGNLTRTAYTPASGGPVTGKTVTNHLNWLTTTTYEPAWGAPTSTVDPNGKRTELAYDGLGRITQVWLPGQARIETPNVQYAYQLRNTGPSVLTTTKLTASGGTTTSHSLYDALLRERQTQGPDGTGGRQLTDTFYDTVGRAVRANSGYVADGAPSTNLFLPLPDAQIPAQTRTMYDGTGRITDSAFVAKDVVQWRTTTTYGGDRTDVTPPAGGIRTSAFFDAKGRTTMLRQYAGTENRDTTYGHDRKNRLVTIADPAGNTWTYGYDLRGRRTTVDDPDKGKSTMEFNDAGDIVSMTDARGRKLTTGYDSLGRRIALRDNSTTDPVRSEWSYDTLAKGQLTKSTRYVGADAYVSEVTGYTDSYLPLQAKITIPEAGLAGTYEYNFTYKSDGSPATTRLPGLGGLPAEKLSIGYDAIGRPQTLSTNDSSTGDDTFLVNGTGYTRFGEVAVIGRRYDGGTWLDTKREYAEGSRRLKQILTTRETNPSLVADVNYAHDPAGNVTRVSDATSGDHQCLAYDALRQLTEAWTPATGDCAAARNVSTLGGPAPYWQSFGYDKAGNRTASTERTPTTSTARSYTYPNAGADHPHSVRTVSATGSASGTSTYTYDATGNTLTRPAGAAGTQTGTWDSEGNLVASVDGTGRTSYVYDADGNRLLRRDPAGKTLYLPSQELRYTTAGSTGTRFYSHAGQTIGVRTSSGLHWQIDDHQGTEGFSVNATSQAVTARRQTPFGAPRGSSVSWPTDKGLVGGTVDNTGTVHLGAREYDTAIGRFTSADPVLDDQDPQQMNGYSYANSTPVTMSDPDGLSPRGSVQNEQKKKKPSSVSPGKKKKKAINYRAIIGKASKKLLKRVVRILTPPKKKAYPNATIIPPPRKHEPATIAEGFGMCDPLVSQTRECLQAHINQALQDGSGGQAKARYLFGLLGGAAGKLPGAGTAWKGARTGLNLPLSMEIIKIAEVGGADCQFNMKHALWVCRNAPGWMYGRGGTTVGSVFLTGSHIPDDQMLTHEEKHADQWAIFGATFPGMYFASEIAPGPNPFEEWAGLEDGCYTQPRRPACP